MMKLQTPARAPRQQTYMGISKKNPNPPTKKLKVPTLQQITKKALNAMLQTPSKVTTPSLISAAERGNQSYMQPLSARSNSPESSFFRSISRDYKWQDSSYSRHYAKQQKGLLEKAQNASKKNIESKESWLTDHKTLKGNAAPGTEIFCEQSKHQQQIPAITSSRSKHIKHDSLTGRFSYAFAVDTAKPRDYSAEKYLKIKNNFYDSAKRSHSQMKERERVNSFSSLISHQAEPDADLRNYMSGSQHRNLPKGASNGFVYDGESDEAHFRKGGKGGRSENYMKMQRTQIANLPGAMPANSSPLKNRESFKKPVGSLLATTPELHNSVSQRQLKFGGMRDSPEIRTQQPTSITPRPFIHKSRYSALVGTSTPMKRSIGLPYISPPKSRQAKKQSLNMIIPKSLVEKEMTVQDGVLEKTIGGVTQTTRDTPSPFSRPGSLADSPQLRALQPLRHKQ